MSLNIEPPRKMFLQIETTTDDDDRPLFSRAHAVPIKFSRLNYRCGGGGVINKLMIFKGFSKFFLGGLGIK